MSTTADLAVAVNSLTPQHQAWIGMAEAKNNLVAELTQAELNAQSLLVVKGDDYKEIDTALAEYRKAHTSMVELRKVFTNKIQEGIIEPLMAFEKRVDPVKNGTYTTLTNTSLTLRKAEADKVARTNLTNQEIAQFKAHCSNEFFRVSAEYRSLIRAEINKQYEFWLGERAQPDMAKLAIALQGITVPPVAKFKPTYITAEQMQAAYVDVHKPDFAAILQEMIEELNDTFANFQSDLANAAAAIAANKEASQLTELAEKVKVSEESAINTLIAASEAVTIAEPVIKKTYAIAIVESEQWAKAVMAAFITNSPNLGKYIRVKSWSKLSIGQMAEYLSKWASEGGDKVKGLTYQEVEK